MSRNLRLGVLSTYPPREDGLATYTRDLLRALRTVDTAADLCVAAISDPGEDYHYPAEVRLEIAQGQLGSYASAVRALAAQGAEVLLIEHEFGLYGSLEPFTDRTRGLLDTAHTLGMPLVTTLHTVQPEPGAAMRQTIRRLCAQSAAVTVMANTSVRLLRDVYAVDGDRVVMIPHGIHEECAGDQDDAKARLGLSGRIVLCTFGLIHRNKGVDVALRALPAIVARHPDAVYIIAGETHPQVRRQEDEAYRGEMVALVKRLGLEQHVTFINHYLEMDEVFDYLRASDVYIMPYRDLTQASSGTLAYALGCGRAVVSTPFVYAREVLGDGRGLLIEPENAEQLAAAVERYLADGAFRQRTQRGALAYGRAMTWEHVAARFAALLRSVARGHPIAPRRAG